jgi:hypothetical protein
VQRLNHGSGFDTTAIELLLPTYGESLAPAIRSSARRCRSTGAATARPPRWAASPVSAARPTGAPTPVAGAMPARPLLTGLCLAAWEALAPLLPAPRVVAGCRVGELAAFSAAGVFTAEAALRLAQQRAELMDARVQGQDSGLLAVTGAAPDAVAIASHTPWLAGAVSSFASVLAGQAFDRPQAALVCNQGAGVPRRPDEGCLSNRCQGSKRYTPAAARRRMTAGTEHSGARGAWRFCRRRGSRARTRPNPPEPTRMETP